MKNDSDTLGRIAARQDQIEEKLDALLTTLAATRDLGQPAPLLLTRREAAQALRISERKLWELTQRGDIPHVRVDRSVRYPVHELREWVKSQTKQTDRAG